MCSLKQTLSHNVLHVKHSTMESNLQNKAASPAVDETPSQHVVKILEKIPKQNQPASKKQQKNKGNKNSPHCPKPDYDSSNNDGKESNSHILIESLKGWESNLKVREMLLKERDNELKDSLKQLNTTKSYAIKLGNKIKDSRIQGILFQYHYIKYHYIQYKQQKQTKDIEEMTKGQKRPEWAIP